MALDAERAALCSSTDRSTVAQLLTRTPGESTDWRTRPPEMMTPGLTMLSIGLVFTLIIALDYPFRGDLSVDDDAYLGVKEVSDRAFEPAGVTQEKK